MRKRFDPKNKYNPYSDEVIMKESVLRVIDFVAKNNDLHPIIRKNTLSYLLWPLTELKSSLKYKTRYYSENALTTKEDLRHEHVYTRKYLISLILNNYDQFLEIMPKIVGCTVTKSEGYILNKVDANAQGWERYKLANIRVFDRQTGEFLW